MDKYTSSNTQNKTYMMNMKQRNYKFGRYREINPYADEEEPLKALPDFNLKDRGSCSSLSDHKNPEHKGSYEICNNSETIFDNHKLSELGLSQKNQVSIETLSGKNFPKSIENSHSEKSLSSSENDSKENISEHDQKQEKEKKLNPQLSIIEEVQYTVKGIRPDSTKRRLKNHKKRFKAAKVTASESAKVVGDSLPTLNTPVRTNKDLLQDLEKKFSRNSLSNQKIKIKLWNSQHKNSKTIPKKRRILKNYALDSKKLLSFNCSEEIRLRNSSLTSIFRSKKIVDIKTKAKRIDKLLSKIRVSKLF
ncbi:unnamed protein product [Moneuplotes crassus]|uniref:Uncharacterized protein n=1 Tax=Euplotes crassus TaxID=5936 RepID=A0AAD1UND5_EUPCR|nr:unnamed protein product [Moneuplotes crassus]